MVGRLLLVLACAPALLLLVIATCSEVAMAEPAPAAFRGRMDRMNILPVAMKERDKAEDREMRANMPAGAAGAAASADEDGEGTTNYLVSLKRTVSNKAKDVILDYLMRQGAVVKQVYDYRVYKGILFSVPKDKDLKLTAWQSGLSSLGGVTSVEEDQLVNTS